MRAVMKEERMVFWISLVEAMPREGGKDWRGALGFVFWVSLPCSLVRSCARKFCYGSWYGMDR